MLSVCKYFLLTSVAYVLEAHSGSGGGREGVLISLIHANYVNIAFSNSPLPRPPHTDFQQKPFWVVFPLTDLGRDGRKEVFQLQVRLMLVSPSQEFHPGVSPESASGLLRHPLHSENQPQPKLLARSCPQPQLQPQSQPPHIPYPPFQFFSIFPCVSAKAQQDSPPSRCFIIVSSFLLLFLKHF